MTRNILLSLILLYLERVVQKIIKIYKPPIEVHFLGREIDTHS